MLVEIIDSTSDEIGEDTIFDMDPNIYVYVGSDGLLKTKTLVNDQSVLMLPFTHKWNLELDNEVKEIIPLRINVLEVSKFRDRSNYTKIAKDIYGILDKEIRRISEIKHSVDFVETIRAGGAEYSYDISRNYNIDLAIEFVKILLVYVNRYNNIILFKRHITISEMDKSLAVNSVTGEVIAVDYNEIYSARDCFNNKLSSLVHIDGLFYKLVALPNDNAILLTEPSSKTNNDYTNITKIDTNIICELGLMRTILDLNQK